MRLWHYKLLHYLPELQFRGQLRELVSIMRDLRDNGQTNHIIINRVMDYDKSDLLIYYLKYEAEWASRYGKSNTDYRDEFFEFVGMKPCCSQSEIDMLACSKSIFDGWHDKTYLRICMANLLEKHMGKGKSKVSDEDWNILCFGYEMITTEPYHV